MAYIGNLPAVSYASFSKQNLVADGSTVSFTLDYAVANENDLEVFVNNVRQEPGSGKAYTASGTTLTMSEAPASGASFYVIFQGKATQTVVPPDGSVTNAKLANSSITINGTSIALGASGSIVAGTDWQSVITADGSTATTAVAGKGYFIDTTSATHTINLPASPTIGDTIKIAIINGSNSVTVNRNGSNINGSASNTSLAVDGDTVEYVYVNSSEGWKTMNTISAGTFISATGGTVTTSGNYKIHTFTGDGCFVVSTVGNKLTNPLGGPNQVDYLVIAGGGGGGNQIAGGGGAGGFRESHSVPVSGCYTASPLATPTGITVSATTYPITVGAGGSGYPSPGVCAGPRGDVGSNSVFSTITSAGGGGGGANSPNPGTAPNQNDGTAGGSGAGGSLRLGTGGAGNTPPVSPPQGNVGGNAINSPGGAGGGGGGAGAAGTTAPGNAGAGGSGTTSSITGSPVTRAGGGGGGGRNDGCNPQGALGGSGGGGTGGNHPTTPAAVATSGTANTGGGGGGGGYCGPVPNGGVGGSGGSGIVIIRYQYQ